MRQMTEAHTGPYEELLTLLSKNETPVVRLCNKIGLPDQNCFPGQSGRKKKTRKTGKEMDEQQYSNNKEDSPSYEMLCSVFVLPEKRFCSTASLLIQREVQFRCIELHTTESYQNSRVKFSNNVIVPVYKDRQ